jgi:DNA invertase Pin-like site-specific DNA recombinase
MAYRQASTDTLVIKRIALYARVSTLNGQNPQLQLDELREYAQRRGWTIAGEYVDLGVSGAKDSRPDLNRMLADAHARKFDGIAVWKLDRLGRSLKHLVTTIEDLQAYNVSFVSLRDNLDLSTPAGRLMLHIIGAMAEFERSLIQERVVAGRPIESRLDVDGFITSNGVCYSSKLRAQRKRVAGHYSYQPGTGGAY